MEMKRIIICITIFSVALGISAVRAEAPELPAAADTTGVAAFKEKNRFLPTSRRIDRKVQHNKFVYKNEFILGLGVSYATMESENSDLLLMLDKFDADGRIVSVTPYLGYFYRDNHAIGVRFGYRNIKGHVDNINISVDLGVEMPAIGRIELLNNNYSLSLFHRSYLALDRRGRFGLFAELELQGSIGDMYFRYQDFTSRANIYSVRLNFNPGAAVYIMPNVCATLSLGMGGLQYTRTDNVGADKSLIGSRDYSKLRFKLNILDINIGMTVHLWNNKKNRK